MSDGFILILMIALFVAAVWRAKYLKKHPPHNSIPNHRLNAQTKKNLMQGFWWSQPPRLPLAAGQGWNTEVRGESFHQDALLRIVGGKGRYGSNWNVVAELKMPNDIPGHPTAVAVHINESLVGYLPSGQGSAIRNELLALPGIENGVTCKATIVGGWDSRDIGGDTGHFGVKLSLSRPLKIRKA